MCSFLLIIETIVILLIYDIMDFFSHLAHTFHNISLQISVYGHCFNSTEWMVKSAGNIGDGTQSSCLRKSI